MHCLAYCLSLSISCLEDFLLAYLAPIRGQTCSPTHLRASIHHLTHRLSINMHCLAYCLSLGTCCLEDFLPAYLAPVRGQTCSPTHLRASIHHLTRRLCLRMCCVTDFLPTFYKRTSMIINSDAHLPRSLSPW